MFDASLLSTRNSQPENFNKFVEIGLAWKLYEVPPKGSFFARAAYLPVLKTDPARDEADQLTCPVCQIFSTM